VGHEPRRRMGGIGLIDKLTYDYSYTTRKDYLNPTLPDKIVPISNKLNKVTDAATGTEGMPTGETAYTYDGMGTGFLMGRSILHGQPMAK